MNAKAWTSKSLLSGFVAGLLLLLLGIPGAFAEDAAPADTPDAPQAEAAESPAGAPQPGVDARKDHEMSPEAKFLGALNDLDAPAQGWFDPDAQYLGPYDAQEQLDIYGKKHMNKTANPPVSLGRRLYDKGAYEPRPTWLGEK